LKFSETTGEKEKKGSKKKEIERKKKASHLDHDSTSSTIFRAELIVPDRIN